MNNFNVLIGVATFANGRKFMIQQRSNGEACRITNLVTGLQSYAKTIANAWKSISFQADIDPRTNRTRAEQ